MRHSIRPSIQSQLKAVSDPKSNLKAAKLSDLRARLAALETARAELGRQIAKLKKKIAKRTSSGGDGPGAGAGWKLRQEEEG